MQRRLRINFILILLFLSGTSLITAQQITKFGVVDTSKVYQAYFRNSAPIRNYESKKKEFQDEIQKRTQELQELQQKKVDLKKQGKDTEVLKVESEISKKTDFLTEYTNAKNIELETMKNNLKSSDEFYNKLYNTLASIAESEGYSMILSLQNSNSILWYSSSIDITNEVISKLGL